MTQTGCVMGTPDYMAPEQARDSHTADIRSDLYSLGCTLYYLLAGRVPFPGGTVTEKMLRHNMDEPTPLEQLRPDVPPAVAAVVRLLMAKRREDRYQTPAELAEALAPLAAEAGGAAPTAASEMTAETPWSEVAAVGEAGPDPAYARPRAAERRRWLLFNLIGAAVFVGLVGLVLGLVWVLRAPPTAPRPAPGPAAEWGGSPLNNLDPTSIPASERFDWQPKELVAVLGEHRGRHWGSAFAVAVSRDGKQVATGGADGLIRFWDPLTGREQREVRAVPAGWIRSLAFSPDARRLACYVGAIGFYDLNGPEPVREKAELPCQDLAFRLVFTPDGKRLVGLDQSSTLSVWDLTARPPKLWMQEKSYAGARGPSGFDLSADGSTLAYIPDEKAVRLLDISGPDARELRTLPLPEPGSTLALSPDGKRLAVGFPGTRVRLWDVTGKAPVPRGVIDSGHAPSVMRFSPDGKRLAVAYTAIRLWDVEGAEPVGGEPFAASLGSTDYADLAFTPDGRILVSASGDSTVRFWDVAGARPQERNPIDPASYLYAYGPARLAAAFSPDGKRVATYHPDSRTRWWDLDGPSPTRLGEVSQRTPAALTPDGRGLLLRAPDGSVSWWDFDATPPRESDRYQTGPWAANALWAAPESRSLVVGTAGGEVRVLERSDEKGLVERSRFQAGEGRVTHLDVSPDGRTLAAATATGVEVKLWDLTREKPAPRGTVQQGTQLWRLAFSPDSRLLFVSTTAGVSVWDVQGGQPGQPAQRAWTRDEGNTYAVAFSPDSRTLATGTGAGKLVLRDARTGAVRKEWQLPGGLYWVGYAPDGRHLLTVNGNHTGYVLRLAGPP
jgi:WD40 repeat protein